MAVWPGLGPLFGPVLTNKQRKVLEDIRISQGLSPFSEKSSKEASCSGTIEKNC